MQAEFGSNPILKPESIERRAYQETIARNALRSNTLVCLPTGLGKSVIGAYVAAEYGAQGLRLPKKHPLRVFCNDGFLPIGLKSVISKRYAAYDFAKIRRDGDRRYNLPEAR